jgi:hypothetical protein
LDGLKSEEYLDASSFFGGIYDFVVGVYNGIFEVVSLIYNAGVATFNFVWNGVKYVFSVVVEFFEQAFGLVESIFAAIKMSFERLFEWLGFVFNWDDILRTRTALSYWILEYLKFLEGAAGGIQAMFDGGIATMKDGVHKAFVDGQAGSPPRGRRL